MSLLLAYGAVDPPVVTPVGTTKIALQSGSLAYTWVFAIEGYTFLLHNSPDDGMVRLAWDSTTYDDGGDFAAPGLLVDLENDQSINPWDPFTPGGSLVIRVVNEQLAVDLAKKGHAGQTPLTATIDSNDTTANVKDTSTFAASGRIHIGTESMLYGSKTGTTFATLTRGTPVPFANGNSGTTFGHQHRVGSDPQNVLLHPAVTDGIRKWEHRWVGLWAHRETGGLLDVRSEAQLVYAGRIVEHRNDDRSDASVIQCEHINDYVRNATIGRDWWQAKIADGVYLTPGMSFRIGDQDGTTQRLSNFLTVVSAGAVAPGEINAGHYTGDQLLNLLNAWAADELDDGRIAGVYTFSFAYGTRQEGYPLRTYVYWNIPGAGPTVGWGMFFPPAIARFLGFDEDGVAEQEWTWVQVSGDDDTDYWFRSSKTPLRSMLVDWNVQPDNLLRIQFFEEHGTFQDQQNTMPPSAPITTPGSYAWGFFLVDNSFLVYGAYDGTNDILRSLRVPTKQYVGAKTYASYQELLAAFERPRDTEPIEIKQLFILDSTFANIIKWLFFSTGTLGYNHATWDALPYTLGLAIPGELLDDAFIDSVDALPCANQPETLVLEKPKRISEALKGSLVARWAFLRWRDQHLEFATWRIPTEALAVATLDETNKAAPPGVNDPHRSITLHTDQWAHPIIVWEYDRDVTANDPGGGYRSSYTFEDATAVDDAGGVAPVVNIQLPGISDKAAVHELAETAKGIVTLFTRGNELLNRTIDGRFYEGYSVGDVVMLQDESARDPETGLRGMSVPALIVRHRWSPGGWSSPGARTADDMTGEVTLLVLPVNRTAKYAPTADVDDTAAGSGYNAGTKVLTLYAHRYSLSSEAADATKFPATSKVRVVERDPPNAAAPLSWDDTVASQSGNTVTLTTGLGGFDTAKKYRLISDDYADANTTQRANVYQADDADHRVVNTRHPYELAGVQATVGTVDANSDVAELPPNSMYGDGAGLAVGLDDALANLARLLADYKVAHSSPFLSNDVMTGTGATGTWKLVDATPIYLHGAYPTQQVYRNVAVAPWFRSSDGASASVRVTLARYMPGSDTVHDIERGAVYAEATFTTTSTSWTTATAANLSAKIVDFEGFAFLLIECTVKAECRGLAECQVSERQLP